MSDEAPRAAERAARLSRGRLVAMLAARGGDIAAAEDALAEAFAAALRTWPERGVPGKPEAWLLVAARRSLGGARARGETVAKSEAVLTMLTAERAEAVPGKFGDMRLELMLVCAHPAIGEAARAPLMLQTVLGLDAARIAASFLVAPDTMARRLSRAKIKIRDARVPFVVPEPDQLSERIGAVLAAVYAAYGTGWEDVLGTDARRRGLAEEAIWLGRLVSELLPDNPEAMGLLALMLHCEARAPARRDATGAFVPLKAQDPTRWTRAHLLEAERLLRAAARFGAPGRFQIEAAIQSLHAQSVMTGEDLGAPLDTLYDLLVTIAPSLGALVARAAARAESDPATALGLLDELAERTRAYQPWWVARARALALLGRDEDARAALTVAAGLSEDVAVRAFLLGKRDQGLL